MNMIVAMLLAGAAGAVIGSILASIMSLVPVAIIDLPTALISITGFVSIVKYKVNVFWCVGISSILGLVLTSL